MPRLQIYHAYVTQFDTLELTNKFSLNAKKNFMLSFSGISVSSFYFQFFLDALCFQKCAKMPENGVFSCRKSFLILELLFSFFSINETRLKNFKLTLKNFFSMLKLTVVKKIPFFEFVVKFAFCIKTIP